MEQKHRQSSIEMTNQLQHQVEGQQRAHAQSIEQVERQHEAEKLKMASDHRAEIAQYQARCEGLQTNLAHLQEEVSRCQGAMGELSTWAHANVNVAAAAGAAPVPPPPLGPAVTSVLQGRGLTSQYNPPAAQPLGTYAQVQGIYESKFGGKYDLK